MEIPTKAVSDIAKALGYRRKKVCVYASESVTLHDLNWSGGTRSQYHALKLSNLENYQEISDIVRSRTFLNEPAPWNNAYEGAEVPLAPGLAIVRTGTFCGKESLMAIYVHPADMPKLLPAS